VKTYYDRVNLIQGISDLYIMDFQKPVHTIVLDTGPILKNDPSLNALLQKSERLITVPAVIAEIKDPNTRSRVETILMPFLETRSPSTESLKVITDFARKSGDLAVLSTPDVQVLALAYEIECQRNGGDWRLRRAPGQKGMNGPLPGKKGGEPDQPKTTGKTQDKGDGVSSANRKTDHQARLVTTKDSQAETDVATASSVQSYSQAVQVSGIVSDIEKLQISLSVLAQSPVIDAPFSEPTLRSETLPEPSDPESSDSDGWITPSNIKKHQAKNIGSATAPISEDVKIQVATITTDFAMQNVLLQMNLNLLSTSLQRVKKVKTWILRCHACFEKTKDMSKQFCSRCGKPTLTRVSCTVNQNGKFKLHLKRNMQWNHRGDRFSIPKPVPGAANGKVGQGKGGGQGGWGQELILAEDQKEYLRAMNGQSRRKEKNLMDEDYLPGILTGDRGRNGGRPKIGGGRNVNSKKRS